MKSVDKALKSKFDLRETNKPVATDSAISGVAWYASTVEFNRENAKLRRQKRSKLKSGIIALTSEETKAKRKETTKLSLMPESAKPRAGIDSGRGLSNGVMLGTIGNFEALRFDPKNEDKTVFIQRRIGLDVKSIVAAVKYASGYRLDKEEIKIIKEANQEGLFDYNLDHFYELGLMTGNDGQEKYDTDILNAVRSLIDEDGFYISEKGNKERKAKGYSFSHSSKSIQLGLRINSITPYTKELTEQQKARISAHKEAKKQNLVPKKHDKDLQVIIQAAKCFIGSTGIVNSKLVFMLENIAVSKASLESRAERMLNALNNAKSEYLAKKREEENKDLELANLEDMSEEERAEYQASKRKEQEEALNHIEANKEKRDIADKAQKEIKAPESKALNKMDSLSAYFPEFMPAQKLEKIEACPVSQRAFELAQEEQARDIAKKKKKAKDKARRQAKRQALALANKK